MYSILSTLNETFGIRRLRIFARFGARHIETLTNRKIVLYTSNTKYLYVLFHEVIREHLWYE